MPINYEKFNSDNGSKSPSLPNVKRPMHPSQQPEQAQPQVSTEALTAIAQHREQASSQVAGDIALMQQEMMADLQHFEQSAKAFAHVVGQRKALIVASLPGLSDSVAASYLSNIDQLRSDSQQYGFAKTEDLNQWAKKWVGSGVPVNFALPSQSHPQLNGSES